MTDPSPRKEAELVELMRAIDVRAPESLHRHMQSLVDERSSGTARHRPSLRARRRERAPGKAQRALGPRLAAVGALAAAAIAALVLGLSSGGSPTLTLRQATALTVSEATAAGPLESPRKDGRLLADVEGVAFPYWEDRFGWRSTGMRTDHLAGRTIRTVYYADGGRRIGYAIVAGANAPPVRGGTVAWRGGHPYTVSSVGGLPVITWLRDGHLCVVSGRGVDSATLLALASWTNHDTLS